MNSETQPVSQACSITARQSMLYAKDLARLYRLEKERAEDLRAGARVQERFLTPAEETGKLLHHAGYNVSIVNTTPAGISGDFYYPCRLGGGAVGFLLADTCGHGLPAAMLSMRIASFVQTAAGHCATPRSFLQRVNSDIYGLDLRGAFVAGIYVIFHATGCSIANAGQPYPLLLRKGQVQELPLPGPPLGLAADGPCPQRDFHLEPGDRLVLLTDGIVEAARPDGEDFGAQRLHRVLADNAQAPVERISAAVMQALQDFLQGAPQDDDHTLVVVEKARTPEASLPEHWTGRVCLGAGEEERDSLYDRFIKALEATWSDQAEADLMLLCLVEAVNNAVEHGNREDAQLRVIVSYLAAPDFCLVMIRDQGPGFEPATGDLLQSQGSRGRGLPLIRKNADVFFHNRQGNTCIICKGANNLDMNSSSVSAKVAPLHGGSVLVTDLDFGAQKVNIANGLAEVFDAISALEDRSAFIDLKRVRLLSSLGWGAIFAQAEKLEVRRIVLFNAGEAIMRSAEQMGLPRNEGPYAKIQIFAGCAPAMELLAGELCNSLGSAPAMEQ